MLLSCIEIFKKYLSVIKGWIGYKEYSWEKPDELNWFRELKEEF